MVLLKLCLLVGPFLAVAAEPHVAPSGRAAWKQKYQRPAKTPYPADNPFSPAKAELGRLLFFDPRLSKSGWISCATCHNPALAWGDGLPKGIGNGMKYLGRKTPTILNGAFQEVFFWDGRASSLEEQALGPIQAEGEMALDLKTMIARLNSTPGYLEWFRKAFNAPPSPERVAQAIATYERSIVSSTAPFDRWIAGDESAISEEAKLGFDVFNGKANCAKCHSGWNFTDDSFHDIGVTDSDRGRALHLKLPSMEHAFKTPTLRQIEQRAPFLHDGSEPTLEAVIDFYDKGGIARRPSLSAEIRPLHLSAEEKRQLRAFLATLTSADPETKVPRLPR